MHALSFFHVCNHHFLKRQDQAWKKCRSRDLGLDKTADFGIKFGKKAILVRVSRIKFKTGWDQIIFFSRPGQDENEFLNTFFRYVYKQNVS